MKKYILFLYSVLIPITCLGDEFKPNSNWSTENLCSVMNDPNLKSLASKELNLRNEKCDINQISIKESSIAKNGDRTLMEVMEGSSIQDVANLAIKLGKGDFKCSKYSNTVNKDIQVCYTKQDFDDWMRGVGNGYKEYFFINGKFTSDSEKFVNRIISQQQNMEIEKKITEIKKNIDVVSQVLNYSSGCSDDGCGTYSSWVVRDQKSCIYDKVNLQDGSVLQTINLNEMDPKSIQVVTMNKADTRRETVNSLNGLHVIGYQNVVTKYQTQDVQYMGKELFSQQNLDINRLKRGWTLIYSKYCSGTRKAF